MLKKRARLTTEDITSLSQGKSVFGTLLSLRILPAPTTKLSVVVSKKVASRAIDRNRLRRTLYAAVEKPLGNVDISQASYIMLMPKKECSTVAFDILSQEVITLFKKAR